MKRIVFLTMIFSLVVTGFAYGKTYKIAVVPWQGCSPAHVAEVKGLWTNQGIDVSVVTFQSPQEMHTALKNKRVDIMYETVGSAIGLHMDGTAINLIAETDWSHGGDKIITKKDLNADQLKGKPIGVYMDQPSVTYFLNQYISSVGLKFSDVRIIEMEAAALADNFIADRFKVIVSYDPDALRAEKDGNGKVIATTSTYEGCMPEGLIVLSDVFASMDKNDLKKILLGWIKAVSWSQDPANWKEFAEILNNYTFKGYGPFSDTELKEMLQCIRIHNAQSQFEENRNDGGLHAYLQDLKAFLRNNNLLKKDFNPEEIFSNEEIMKVLDNEKRG